MYRPEIGEECEVLYNTAGPEYCKARIIGNDGERIVYKFLSGERLFNYSSDCCYSDSDGNPTFRPLKSKRDEEIEGILSVLPDIPMTRIDIANKLYDAGYRKQMPYDNLHSLASYFIWDEFGVTEDESKKYATKLCKKLNRTPDEG